MMINNAIIDDSNIEHVIQTYVFNKKGLVLSETLQVPPYGLEK